MQAAVTVTPSRIPDLLLGLATVRPVFVWGAPGIGKSSLVRAFAESLGLDYPILSDPDNSVATKYGVLNESPKGKAAKRWTFYIGADGKILAIDKEVKTETHGADVAGKLGQLGVAKAK